MRTHGIISTTILFTNNALHDELSRTKQTCVTKDYLLLHLSVIYAQCSSTNRSRIVTK